MRIADLVVLGDVHLEGYRPVRILNWDAAVDVVGKGGVLLVAPEAWDEEKAGTLEKRGANVVKLKPGWEAELGNVVVWKQSLVSVAGGSGCGRTLVAALLSLGACRTGLSVLLVDLNAGYGGGDMSFYFDLPQVPNWNTFLAGEQLESCVVRGPVNRLRVLQVPPTPVRIPGSAVEEMLRQARESYDLVVFDLPAGAGGIISEAFPRSSQYVVMVNNGRKDGGENVVLNDRWGGIRKADVPHVDALAKLETVGGWRGLDGVGGLPDAADRLIKKIFGGVRRG